ncbi:hypothetical protein QBC46DRAFT_448750 [Diplogelasinospora grovesii]|uniref:Ankyrin n=1 Tax=Diplogelasinospora grovesii TaxID=303347 RepID=A0AAN6S5L3_9PEZI|nr:hypothetical protein QBC46DRAFT_448750 [Diplogelasinospora grovesii]
MRLEELNAQPRESGGRSGVAFLYLNYQVHTSESQLLGCIIRQLVEDEQPLPDTVKQQWAKYSVNGAALDEQKLIDLLRNITDDRKVYIVVDALDECPPISRKPLIDALTSLGSTVGLMVTSRHMADFDQLSAGFCRVQILANSNDISDYVNHRIDGNPRLLEFTTRDKSLRGDIHKTVLAKSQKMFLLVRLHMESLEADDIFVLDHVRESLAQLTDRIDDKYTDIIHRIEQQTRSRRDLAIKTLCWVAYAARPLSIGELQHALAVDVEDVAFRAGRTPRIDDIVGFCCGLVILETLSDTVRLVHYTASTYMNDIHVKDQRFTGAHIMMARICGTYLCFQALEEPDEPDGYISTKPGAYPFAEYAAVYLGSHLRSMEDPQSNGASHAITLTTTILDERKKRKFYTRLLHNADAYPPRTRGGSRINDFGDDDSIYETRADPTEREVTSLHLAAQIGIPCLVQTFLDVPNAVQAKDKYGLTPLIVALYLGHAKIASMLLDAGASLDVRSRFGGRVLLFIAQSSYGHGHEKLVGQILGRTTGVQSSTGQQRLQPFSRRSNSEQPRSEPDESANSGAISYNNPSQAPTGHESELEDYLELAWAAMKDDCVAIKAIIDQRRVVVTLTEDKGLSNLVTVALFLAVENQHTDVLKILIGHGVDINSRDFEDRTPLHRAVVQGCVKTVKLLLEHGADLEATDGWRDTPWLLAARSSNNAICQILRDKGADVNKLSHGENPINSAARNGNLDDVKFLLNQGVNPSIRDNISLTPLHWAAKCGHVECVRLLLDAKADVNAANSRDQTPLHLAAENGHVECVRLLLDAGADVSAANYWDETPLDIVMNRGNTAIEQILRAAGAKSYSELRPDTTGGMY